MAQVDRYIKGNPALDDIDHALGRPYNPFETYRNHYATVCPEKINELMASPFWSYGVFAHGMWFFEVSIEGREALADELADVEKYGRLYEITSKRYDGFSLVFAKSRSQAKYRAWLQADLDWSFMDYCKEISARLSKKPQTFRKEPAQ